MRLENKNDWEGKESETYSRFALNQRMKIEMVLSEIPKLALVGIPTMLLQMKQMSQGTGPYQSKLNDHVAKY